MADLIQIWNYFKKEKKIQNVDIVNPKEKATEEKAIENPVLKIICHHCILGK